MKVIKWLGGLCVGCVLLMVITLSVAGTAAGVQITQEAVAAREEREQTLTNARVYAKKHCKMVGTIRDPLNKSSIQRFLYRCPAYQMMVI